MNIGIRNDGGTIEGEQIIGVGIASNNDSFSIDMSRINQKLNEIQDFLSKNQEPFVKHVNMGITNNHGTIKGRQIVGVGTASNKDDVSKDMKTVLLELGEVQDLLLKNQESLNNALRLLETVTSIRSDLSDSPPNKNAAKEKIDKLASVISSMAILVTKANELKSAIPGLF
ncbi:MAG: hypothetical protein EHM14_02535 [Methanothrix sp.]|nr:MAG: hypothetical protein EHM14_02535 [Methanothrix sp.]